MSFGFFSGIFNLKGRAKWDAWKQVSSLSKEDAQETYVDKVKEFYGWSPPSDGRSKGSTTKGSVLGGITVSTMGKETEEEQLAKDKINNPVFAWAKDNDIVKIKQWLEEVSVR